MRFFKYFSIAIVAIIAAVFWQNHHSEYQVLSGNVFGTYYNIKVRSDTPIKNHSATINNVFQLVNNQMSIFTKDSEVNMINQSSAGKWIEVSPELYLVLETSEKIYKESKGAFDPSVAPLVNLWGFGTDGRRKIPSDIQIKTALKNIGFNKLKLQKTNLVQKSDDKVHLNLSAIAKGYAVDLVAKHLKKLGYEDFLVDIGGEVYASGNRKMESQGWNIGIAEPSEKGNKNLFTLGLKDIAVATSGDYNNFYYQDAKRYSHTISPQTGYPTEHNLVSATVFNKSCMEADAYATALMSMGEAKGIAFANKYNIAAILFVKNSNNQIQVLYSKQAKILIGE